MKLRTTRLKLRTTRCSVLALAAGALLSLGACGGGSNDPVAMQEDPPPVVTPVAVQLPDGHMLEAGDRITIEAGATSMVGGTVFSCNEGGPNCVITVVEADGSITATSTGGVVMVMAAELVEKMEMINLPAGNGLTPVVHVGVTAEPFTVPAGESETRGGTVFTCPPNGGECTVKLTNSGGVVTATGTGGVMAYLERDVLGGGGGQQPPPVPRAGNNPVVVDLAGIKKYALLDALTGKDGKGVGAITGYTFGRIGELKDDVDKDHPVWRGGEFTKDAGGGIEEVLRLYSNREPGRTFAAAYGERAGNPNDITSGELGAHSFWMLAANNKNGLFPVAGGAVILDPVKFVANVNVEGTFNGIAGHFKCTSSGACEVSVGEDNNLIGTGSWTFTATQPTNTIDKDSDYIVFGWWAVGVTDDETKDRTDFEAFFVGNDPFSGDVLPLIGKATYTGKAAGRYSNRGVGPPDTITTRGIFSADATITANFDTDSIVGKVDKFVDQDQNGKTLTVLLTLEKTSLSNANTFNGDLTGNVSGRTGVTGAWNGQFFGNEAQPTGVAGEFIGRQGSRTGNDGFFSVAGAFGANK